MDIDENPLFMRIFDFREDHEEKYKRRANNENASYRMMQKFPDMLKKYY